MTDKAIQTATRIVQHLLSGDLGESELEKLYTLVQGASWSDESHKVVVNAANLVKEIFHRDAEAVGWEPTPRKPWENLLPKPEGTPCI